MCRHRPLLYAIALLALIVSGCDDEAPQPRLDGDALADGNTGGGGTDQGPDDGHDDGGGSDFGTDGDLGANGDEVCNGVDDDGDGTADEGTSGRACPGTGTAAGCTFMGKTECRDGTEICVISEICNNADDDCDGTVDEAIEETECYETVEECRIRGARRCVGGTFVCELPDEPPEADDEICDDADNDCDGVIDEDLTPATCSAGHAACRTEAPEECVDGVWLCPAMPDETFAMDEECNGIDDDCDGVVDEAVPTRGECSAGAGVCRVVADETCVDGEWTCPAMEDRTLVADETCNARDDDCDGDTDEGDGPNGALLGEPCSAGLGVCRVEGTEVCRDGALICPVEAANERMSPEMCNGLDDDCDGYEDATGPPGAIDDRPVCGEYVTQNCRLWLGWSRLIGDQEPGEAYTEYYDAWSVCPARYPQFEGDVRCNATEGFSNFHLIPVNDEDEPPGPQTNEVAANDKLAWAFECGIVARDAARSDGTDVRLAPLTDLERWVMDHCTAYLTHGSGELIPESALEPAGAADWPPCEGETPRATLPDRAAGCNSTSNDFAFRPIQFPWAVDERDAVGVAFRCHTDSGDEAEQLMADAIEQDVEIFVAWAPAGTDGVGDQRPTWAGCGVRGAPTPDGGLCVGSAGDGRFHALRLGPGAEIGYFGFALKSRPRTLPLREPEQR